MEVKKENNSNLYSSIMNVDKDYIFNDLKDSSPILTQNTLFSKDNYFKDSSSLLNKNASINCLEQSKSDVFNKDSPNLKFFDNSVIRNINSGLTRNSLSLNNDNLNSNNNNLQGSLDSCNMNYFRETLKDSSLSPTDFIDKHENSNRDYKKEDNNSSNDDLKGGLEKSEKSNSNNEFINDINKESNILLNGINTSSNFKKIKEDCNYINSRINDSKANGNYNEGEKNIKLNIQEKKELGENKNFIKENESINSIKNSNHVINFSNQSNTNFPKRRRETKKFLEDTEKEGLNLNKLNSEKKVENELHINEINFPSDLNKGCQIENNSSKNTLNLDNEDNNYGNLKNNSLFSLKMEFPSRRYKTNKIIDPNKEKIKNKEIKIIQPIQVSKILDDNISTNNKIIQSKSHISNTNEILFGIESRRIHNNNGVNRGTKRNGK